MAIRYTVQADDREECMTGLKTLLEAVPGLVATLTPRQVIDDRWMARAREADGRLFGRDGGGSA